MAHSLVLFPFQHANASCAAAGEWEGRRKVETPGMDRGTVGNRGHQCLQHVQSPHCCQTDPSISEGDDEGSGDSEGGGKSRCVEGTKWRGELREKLYFFVPFHHKLSMPFPSLCGSF